MRFHVRRRYVAILTLSKLLLICILVCFLIIPLLPGNNEIDMLNQVNLQIARTEYFAQAVEILEYRPLTYHSEAISGIETNLPLAQQVQNGLLNGNPSLSLPSNPSDDVRQLLINAQPDYNAVFAALKTILANPDKLPDLIQVDIVMQHAQTYAIALYEVVLDLTKHAEEKKIFFFIIDLVLIILITLDIGGGYLFLIRPALKEVQNELISAQATSS